MSGPMLLGVRHYCLDDFIHESTNTVIVEMSSRHRESRQQYQLAIVMNFAAKALSNDAAMYHSNIPECSRYLRMLMSREFCTKVLFLDPRVRELAPGLNSIHSLSLCHAFRNVLRWEHQGSFKLSQQESEWTAAVGNIIRILEHAGQAWSNRKACAVMRCERTNRAIACLYLYRSLGQSYRERGVYIVFDPCPSVRIAGVIDGGATFFCHRDASSAISCIRGLLIADMPPASFNQRTGNDVEAWVFSGPSS